MGNRGKLSVAQLSVIGPGGVEEIRRPQAPEELTAEQSREWVEVVNSMPAKWFPRETRPLLVPLCRHIVSQRRIAERIEYLFEQEDFDFAEYDNLLKAQERESRILASLSVKLRIAQSTEYNKETKRQRQSLARNWSPRNPSG